jgi:hypothetical protein
VEQRWLLPPSVQELVPEDHLAHFVRETVREDQTEITSDGELVLDVSADVDAVFGGYMNDIRLEPEYVVMGQRPGE